jgi:hypothetical protein
MTQSVRDKAISHYKQRLASKLYKYHVEEWDCDIYYRSTSSMRTESKIMALTQNGKSAEALVESIILKALDQDGNRVFSEGDRPALLNEVDPKVIIKVASQLNNVPEDETIEAIEKN